MTSSASTDVRHRFPVLLRYGRALELARLYGVTRYGFDSMVASGVLPVRHIAGKRAHYEREKLIAVFGA